MTYQSKKMLYIYIKRLRGKDVGDLLKILNLKSANDYQAMKKQLGNILRKMKPFLLVKLDPLIC